MRIAVLGVSGMLGNAAFRLLSDRFPGLVFGSARSAGTAGAFKPELAQRIFFGVDVENVDSLTGFIRDVRPRVVFNCVGIIKQLASANDPLAAIPINSIFPHRLARICELAGARLIHVSTDCVFTGRKGFYVESDIPDAEDLYGRSKLLGEVDYPNAVTLRTSIIGREMSGRNGLVDWFLGERGRVRGFKRAIFSGLTTDELVKVVADQVLPRPDLRGVYHVSAEPISKHDLLATIKNVYGLDTEIEPDNSVVIDRSLDSSRFRGRTGYEPPSWKELIDRMHSFGAANERVG